jgi:hypothetical protein
MPIVHRPKQRFWLHTPDPPEQFRLTMIGTMIGFNQHHIYEEAMFPTRGNMIALFQRGPRRLLRHYRQW